MRQALLPFYPNSPAFTSRTTRSAWSTGSGDGRKVRVLVESADGEDSWSTIGISENLVNASWNALIVLC